MTESEIRNALMLRISASTNDAETAFISEMFIDKFSRRADLIVVNGKLSVFEIKSERDTLDRLDGQISSYQNFFEEVTVVCATKHKCNVEAQVPQNVGIWLIDSDGHLSVFRKAKSENLPSVENWLSFLPVDELKKMLRDNGISPAGKRSDLVEVASYLAVKKVRTYVLTFLRRRSDRIDGIRIKKEANRKPSPSKSTGFYLQQLRDIVASVQQGVSAIPRRIAG